MALWLKIMEVEEQDETVVQHEHTYGKDAFLLMLAQPLNMFEKIELKVLHKQRHEEHRQDSAIG